MLFFLCKGMEQISNLSIVGKNFRHGKDYRINEFTKIGDNVSIGNNFEANSHCIIGNDVTIGNNVKVGAHCLIGNNVKIDDNVSLKAFCEIRGDCIIGKNCSFGSRCTLADKTIVEDNVIVKYGFVATDTPKLDQRERNPCFLGARSRYGANVTIMPGVTIGKNSEIGACSQVRQDVPDNEVWYGNPAKFYRKI